MADTSNLSTAVIVPTCNAGEQFKTVMESLHNQTEKFDIKIIDSSSTDQTVLIATKYEADTIIIAVGQAADLDWIGDDSAIDAGPGIKANSLTLLQKLCAISSG